MTKKHFKLHIKDLELLDEIDVKPVKLIAEEQQVEENAIYQKLKGIRGRISEYQWYINNVLNRQRKSPRVRKMTISGTLETDDDVNSETLE